MFALLNVNAGGGDGAEVIYALRNDSIFADKIGTEFVKAGQNYRSSYQKRSSSDPSKDYYFMHRETPNNETVIIEYGFLDSSKDDVLQLKNNWEKLAEGVVKATVEYAGGTYVPIDQSNIYIVEAGDSLYSIARKFNTTVDNLKKINELTSEVLQVGQIIYITDMSDEDDNISTDSYIVQAGDNLYSIAKTFGISVDEIKKLNNLTSDLLSIGQVLILKDNNEPDTTLPPVDPDNSEYYIVKAGDTLYSIAKLYNMSVDEIISINNLNSNILSIGQKLLLKKSENDSTEYDTYIVKSGDSLYSIARLYGTTVDNIKNLNNLSSDILSINQVLKVPKKVSDNLTEYIVVRGDSLYSIAKKFGTTVNEIKTLNNLSGDLLSVGQIILLP